MAYIIAIVGRPNVGKSTLYNRLIGERKAIIDDYSGVTRDRIYGYSDWNGKSLTIIDTGGFVKNTEDIFEKNIKEQVNIAMDEADAIIFLTDVTCGITDQDDAVADILRRSNKPVIQAVNKVDNSERHFLANEFWALGFENTFFLSSMNGSGTGEMLDCLVELLPEKEDDSELFPKDIPKVAVVGQPNVGKSSFVNALLGEDRNVVTEIAGTTRDAVHSHYKKFNHEFILIDTAGIRKKNKVHEDLEFYSVLRAFRAIDEADLCILMIDATLGVESQDMAIYNKIIKSKRSVIVLVNKWDLVEKETNTARDYEKIIKEKLAPFNDVPVVFTSALEKQRIFKTIELIQEVYANRSKKIRTSLLNEFLQESLQEYQPPAYRGKMIKVKYVTQLPTPFPSFAFFCNHPQHVRDNYRNYLNNQLRKRFNFCGSPVSVFFREK